MKIRIQESNYVKNCRVHTMVARKCVVCGKLFIRYSKAKKVCSKQCEKMVRKAYDAKRIARIRSDPVLKYKNRKSTIEARERQRKDKIRDDLPNIKRALEKGDDALVDYIFDHYGFNNNKRTYDIKKGICQV